MASIVKMLCDAGKINPPTYAKETEYETIMGSVAYSMSNDLSDTDVYGFCIPSKEIMFPHLVGHVTGFGHPPKTFEQFQQHHIPNPNGKDVTYDVVVYNITKYFTLCMDGNPNMLDSLFTPQNCVLHNSEIGLHVRNNRKLFLSKNVKSKFIGYAYSELHKVDNKKYENSHRKEIVEQHGYDAKNLSHCRRLISEAEQILTYGDMDLGKDNEVHKAIRRYEVPIQEVKDWFYAKEKTLEELYHTSVAIPLKPDEDAIKRLLLECLEIRFGNLSDLIVKSDDTYQEVVMSIKKMMKDRGLI